MGRGSETQLQVDENLNYLYSALNINLLQTKLNVRWIDKTLQTMQFERFLYGTIFLSAEAEIAAISESDKEK